MSDAHENEVASFVVFFGEAPISTVEAYRQRIKDVTELLAGRSVTEVYITSCRSELFQLWLVFSDGSSYEFGSRSAIDVLTTEGCDPIDALPGRVFKSFDVNWLCEGRSELVLHASDSVTCRLSTPQLFHLDAVDRPVSAALLWLALGSDLLLHAGEFPEEQIDAP